MKALIALIAVAVLIIWLVYEFSNAKDIDDEEMDL